MRVLLHGANAVVKQMIGVSIVDEHIGLMLAITLYSIHTKACKGEREHFAGTAPNTNKDTTMSTKYVNGRHQCTSWPILICMNIEATRAA